MLEVLQTSVDSALAEYVLHFWNRAKGNVPGLLSVPYLDILEDGGVLLTWDREAHHFDVEIAVGRPLEFFYRNRITSDVWEAECAPFAPLSEEVLTALNAFRIVR